MMLSLDHHDVNTSRLAGSNFGYTSIEVSRKEANVLRMRLPLPGGYRVVEVQNSLRLLDPRGTLLHEERRGPAAAATLDTRAWQDVWTQVERELNEEVAALLEDRRLPSKLRRLPQYLRMVSAIAAAPVRARARLERRTLVAGLALAASTAVIAATLLTAPLRIAKSPEQVAPRPSAAAPARSEERRSAQAWHPRSSDAPRQAGIVSRPVKPKPLPTVGYMVNFGEFTNRAAADVMMRLVRSKGQVAYVVRIGSSFHVVTRPYRSLEQAERLANALQEIGLPARAQIATTPIL